MTDAEQSVANARSLLSDFENSSVEEKHGSIHHAINELESGRKRYSPFTEVLVTHEKGGDTERLYVGQIIGTSMLRTWTDENGDQQHIRYVVEDRIDTPRPMALEDVVEWVESAPDELNEALENDLGTSIGFSEYYPREDNR